MIDFHNIEDESTKYFDIVNADTADRSTAMLNKNAFNLKTHFKTYATQINQLRINALSPSLT